MIDRADHSRSVVHAHRRANNSTARFIAFLKDKRSDCIGIAWIVLLAALFLSPALKDGFAFGPADIGAGLSTLTNHAIAVPNHNVVNGDIITQDVPWNTLNWQLVHHGELPLWNSYSGSGLPQLLNFESSTFGLPNIVSYAFPLSMAFFVVIALKLLIAGLGTYLFVRLLGARPVAAFFAGTTYMLSGAFSGWLGWAVSGPLAWIGFICAGVVLTYRSRGRVREVALLAFAVAFSIYGGFPESQVLLVIGLGVLCLAGAVMMRVHRQRFSPEGIVRIGLGIGLGGALSAPLWLPGLSLLKDSARASKVTASGLPLHAVLLAFTQGFDGLPIKGSAFFGPLDYYETAAYVGVIAIVFGGTALALAWRRPAVFGLGLVALCSLGLVYDLGPSAPMQRIVKHLGLKAVALQRMLPVLAFAVAVLAGLGLEMWIRRWRERDVQRVLSVMCGLVGLVLLAMWVKVASAQFLPGPIPVGVGAHRLRATSLLWPTAEVLAIAAMVVASNVYSRRQRNVPAVALCRVAWSVCALQSAFLLFAGVGLNSYATSAYPSTTATTELQAIVGNSLVGFDGPNVPCGPTTPPVCGIRSWTGYGFYPEINIAYGVRELAMHDPVMPAAIFDDWPIPNSDQTFSGNLNLFVPQISSVALARMYGVSYVIVPTNRVPPSGMHRVASLVPATKTSPKTTAGTDLYLVPDSGQFSFPSTAKAHVVTATQTGDRSYRIVVNAQQSAQLTLRITDVPGWHASIDGKGQSTSSVDGEFFALQVPPGHHVISFSYWPRRLSIGLVLALLAVLFLVGTGTYRLLIARRATRNS